MADRDDAVPGQGEALTRRQALTAVGLLAAGTGVAAAESARVGVAQAPANAAEFRARFVQSGQAGEDFAAFGYLTRAQGVGEGDLFVGPVQNESTALLTAYAAGSLAKRNLDRNVHALDIEGTLTIYQRPAPGASFDLPQSFQVGLPVARFELTLQDILTVFLPGRGLPTLTGAMRQTLSDALGGSVAGRRFGNVGSRARLFATGVGDLVDPVTLNALLEMAGNWVIE